jgi:hypothetical protein
MPEKIVFILSTARTGTKTLAEGLRSDDILSLHQPAFSRLLTIASNFYLQGWLPERRLKWLVSRFREPQILGANCRYYVQAYSLDHLPAKIISQRYSNVYIVHIVRDPRTFVPSYLNWMHTRFKSFVANKLVPGWHPSGFFTGQVSWHKWRRMDEFQKVCWHWTYKNALLERLFEGDERYTRVRFEDLFGGEPEVLRSTLDFIGIPYRQEFAALLQQHKNVSHKSYFPTWHECETQKKQQLLEICGEGMQRYGYR